MADEDSNNSDSKENVSYVRKKNIISGVDNDFLLAVLGGGALALGIANLPQVQDWVRNLFKQMPPLPNQPQMQPNNGHQLAPPRQISSEPSEVPQGNRVVTKPPANEQTQYARAVEEENQQGGQYNSFNALPERTMQDSKDKENKRKPYVPGSNVSAGL